LEGSCFVHFAATLPGRSLPEVLTMCTSKGVDASLEVSGPQHGSTIWLRGGQIVFAQSAGTLALTEALTQLGLVTDGQLLKLRQEGGVIEDALVSRGLVKPQVITYIRAFQIADTIYQILEWDRAGFEVREGNEATALKFVHPEFLPQYDWMAEVQQFAAGWATIREKVGSPRAILKRGPNPEPETLQPPEKKLVDLVDGKRPLREVVLWSGMNFVTAHKVLASLLDRLLISPADGERPGGKPRNLKGIQDVLRNVTRLPAARSALLVDRTGKLIAHAAGENGAEVSEMASIFALTVGDFETHLQIEEAARKIEQILVEHQSGIKTILAITSRVILAVEVDNDCDWGLLRLETARSMKALYPCLGD
jgi:predicted regulator of Ras-like GTPase activity (Roadblock/LC7/MglB family)